MMNDDTSAHTEPPPDPWENDPFGRWVFLGAYRMILLGSVILMALCVVLALALRISVENVEWAVPVLNYLGGLLLGGGLIVYIGKRTARLLIPVGAVLVVAAPYALFSLISETAALTAGFAVGFFMLAVLGLGVLGFRQQRIDDEAARRRRSKGRQPAEPAQRAETVDHHGEPRPTTAALACGYLGAVSLTLGLLVDLLQP